MGGSSEEIAMQETVLIYVPLFFPPPCTLVILHQVRGYYLFLCFGRN